jgi:iron(III) transport system substrate-binding protein
MKRRFTIAVLLSAILLGTTSVPGALAQQTPNETIYQYKASDRNEKLVREAQQEGTLTWYTSLAPTESTPLAQAFEKKYGIKVAVWRAISEKVVQRAIVEGRARRHAFDVVESNSPEIEMIAREKLLAPFYSPYFADLPSFAIPKSGMWVADRMIVYGVAFNTNAIKREELPATYEGFLEPKWKGKLGVEATDGEWMSGVVKAMGEQRGMEFMRKLGQQRPDVRKSHILLAELVSAGEVPVALTAYKTNADAIKRKGGPVDVVAMDPIVVRPQAIGLAKNAPHPHAALLFADFVLSPEGQGMLEIMGRSPVSTKIKSELSTRQYTMLDPIVILDESEKWQKLWDELFVKK